MSINLLECCHTSLTIEIKVLDKYMRTYIPVVSKAGRHKKGNGMGY